MEPLSRSFPTDNYRLSLKFKNENRFHRVYTIQKQKEVQSRQNLNFKVELERWQIELYGLKFILNNTMVYLRKFNFELEIEPSTST